MAKPSACLSPEAGFLPRTLLAGRAPPGIFTLQCGTHEAFTSNENVCTIDVNGASYNEIVWNWWRGAQPQQNFANYNGVALPLVSCPPPD